MRIGIATDHGGLELKEGLVAHLREAGHEVVDGWAYSLNPEDDYPDFVIPLAQMVAAGNAAWQSAAAVAAPPSARTKFRASEQG